MDEYKVCTKCGLCQPVSEFHRDRNRRDGLCPWCKACNRRNAKRWRDENVEHCRSVQRQGYRENREARIATVRAYAERSKAAISERARAYYAANRTRLLSARQQYRLRYPDRVRAAQIESARRKPDLYRAISRMGAARRSARLRGALVLPFTRDQLDQRLSMFGHRCWMCGAPWSEVDHVKPVAKGGPHVLANLRPACGPCNRAKSDHWPFAQVLPGGVA